MCTWTALVIRNAPRRWTFMTASQSSSGILKIRLSRMMPALLTRMVGAPSLTVTSATAASTPSGELTSTATAMARPPAEVIADTVSAHDSSSRSRTATACPSLARRIAVAAPMPRAAPVTIAVRWVVVLTSASKDWLIASISRTCSSRGMGKDVTAGRDERLDDVPDLVEARAHGLTGGVPVVDAFTDDRELVVAESRVPGQVTDIQT